jgi:hypothetical protein
MRRSLALALLSPLAAAAEPIDPALLGGAPRHEARLAEVGADLRASFDAALARYDAEITAQPHRVPARIARCRFIESFLLEYEYASFADELYDMESRCFADVAAEFPEHPEVRLSQLERTYDNEERLALGLELTSSLDARGWTAGQRARLYTLLAHASEALDTERKLRERTAEYADQALTYDIRADVRLVLVRYYHEIGNRDAALAALTSPFDGHDPEDNGYLVTKMGYLADLGERGAVLAAHEELASRFGYYDRTQAAAALRAVGEAELALRELSADGAAYYGTGDERERFRLALESGTAEDARAAYEAWRDVGFGEDPLGINRFALFVAHPGLPWRARDLLGLAAALGTLAALVLLWWVPLGLIHYRGLVNRVRGAPLLTDGLGLRDAWLGLAAMTIASFASLYAVGPIDLFAYETASWGVVGDDAQIAKMIVVESLLGAVLLAFVAQVLRRHFGRWWSTDWSIARCALLGAGVAAAFRLPVLAMMLAGVDLSRTLPLDNALWQMLAEVDELYGAGATLWILAVAAPVGEEFLFRGVLLRAALRHVSFAAANAVQALLFAAVHFDLAAAPYLFACGLAFGWLARSSGGLLAPMIAHSIFNLILGLALIF